MWISEDVQLFVKKPENFSGKNLSWYESGQLMYEENYKNGVRID